MAQISRHKLIAPVCEVGSLWGVGSGPRGPEGTQLSGPWVVPTHILPDSLRPPCYIQRGVGLLLGGWLGPEPQRGVLGRGAHPGQGAPLS